MTNQPSYHAGPGGYPAGPSGYPTQTQSGNGLAVAGMVCAIVGLPLLVIPILGILGIVFGGIGLSRANRGAKHKGMALTGLILGAIDILLLAVLLITNGGSFSYHVGT